MIPPLLRRAGVVAALSGGATLAAEVLGARLLRMLLGSAGLALSATLAGTLGGIGLGAALGARALRTRDPRTLLSRACVALWLYASLAPSLASLLATPVARALVSLPGGSTPWGDLGRVVLGVALTALPGALAGAVFPCAVALSAREEAEATAFTGALSSLGAASFALAAVFLCAPALGVATTLRGVALAWLAAALIARQTHAEAPVAQGISRDHPPPSPRALVAALLLTGFASTSFSVALTRLAELSFGPSAYALAAATAAHVTALALGEFGAWWSTRRAAVTGDDDARTRWSWALLGATLAGAATLPAAMSLPRWTGHLLAGGVRDVTPLWLGAIAGVTALALPTIAGVGASMAFAARALGGERPGAGNGRMLAATAAGNVLGALLTPSLLLPALRIEGALAGSVGALALGWSLVTPKPLSRKGIVAAAALLGALLGARSAGRDPAGVLDGPFLYAGSTRLDLGAVVWRRDGREATVAVRRAPGGAVLLQINGKVDATSDGDAATQTVVGLLPVALAHDPRDVLVIGLGSGMTADAARSVDGVRSVRVLELIPEVIDAARSDFREANRAVLDDPRVRVEARDAAHALRGLGERFDAIVSEPSNPWVTGMSDLFTREAFEAARARLRPGGTFGAWFHAYSTDAQTVAAIVETFRGVFPRATLVEVGAGVDYLLIGGREPWSVDLDVTLERLRGSAPRAMLRRAGITSDADLMARFLSGPRGVAAVAQGAEALRATDLRLEFRAPRLLYRDARAEVFARFDRVQDLPLAGLVRASGPGSTWLRLVDRSEPAREAAMHLRRMSIAEDRGDHRAAIAAGELAVGLRHDDTEARTRLARLYLQRALQRFRARDPGGAEADLTTILELRPLVGLRLRALVLLCDLALRRRDPQRALARVDEALRIADASRETAPELHVRRAEALAGLHAPRAAAEALDQAIRETADPARRRALEALRQGRR